MMQSPPPYVPVVEYVLKALEHPPYMYVAKLAACCTMLFLTRENPELLQELCHKWALRFRQDRTKLINSIRNRASYCVNSPEASTELDASEKANSDEGNDVTDGENSSSRDTQRNEENEEEVLGGMRCCDPDTAVEHLLSILNTLVPMYFSWNWHRADYVIQINKEYEAYVREFILPVCSALAPEEGVDDEEHTPWLLPPHTYLDASQSTSGFYSPTSAGNQFPPTKATAATEVRHGISYHPTTGGSGGGISTTLSKSGLPLSASASAAAGAPTELEGLGCSCIQNHFTNTPTSRKSMDRHTTSASSGGAGVVGASPLPKFSPLHPSFSNTNYRDLPFKNSSLGSAPAAATPTGSVGGTAAGTPTSSAMQSVHTQASSGTVSVPAMSPNVMSAGVFNASAVYGLRFLTLGTYNAALRHNTRGLVTVFHAKYSVRSNEVIEALQKIAAKRLLNPMPTIAVVYAVAEPELSTLYKVSWFPTIVYTPPLSSQHHHKRSGKSLSASQVLGDGEGGRGRLSVATKRHSKLSRRNHSHSHRRSRHSTQSATVTQPQSVASRPLSGSDSQLDMAPTSQPTPTPAGAGEGEKLATTPTSNGGLSQNGSGGAAQYEEEERAKWESPSRDAATPASRRNSELVSGATNALPATTTTTTTTATNTSSPHVVLPLNALPASKITQAAIGNTPMASLNVPAATSAHLSPSVPTSRFDNSSVSLPSGVSGPLSAAAPMAPTPTELLFGISVEDTSMPPMQLDQTPQRPQDLHRRHRSGGSVDNGSLASSDNDNVITSPHQQQQQQQQQQTPTATQAAADTVGPYPAHHQPLLDSVQHDGHVIYPLRGDLTVPALVEWISARGASVPRLGKLRDVSTCLKSIRQEEKFKRYRELHSAVVTLRRLQGQGNDLSASGSEAGGSSPASRASGTATNGKFTSSSQQQQQQQPERPLFIFLGGGMAAGKTTAVAALAKSSWWQGHKEQSVVVNADEFKLPLECEMSSVEAHKHSTRAAENLLVKAVNQGRSIVLDGTMMWKPFVQQVVAMVRVAHLTLFKQGPGYDPKTKTEQYFLADKKRQPALVYPYKIIFLGITVDVETAVPRGFLRKFSTNRGVPISMQLRSFKMFSENFADYVAMMDETTLYNNNVFVDLEKGELPPVMAECNEETKNKLLIHDEAAFQQFVRQQQINENADNAMQVYPSSPVMTDYTLPTGEEKPAASP